VRGRPRHPDRRAGHGEDEEPREVEAPDGVDERERRQRRRRGHVGDRGHGPPIEPVRHDAAEDPDCGGRRGRHRGDQPGGEDVAGAVEDEQGHQDARDALAQQREPVGAEVDRRTRSSSFHQFLPETRPPVSAARSPRERMPSRHTQAGVVGATGTLTVP
jgi:hypothetical protein